MPLDIDSIIAAHRAAPGLDPQTLYGASSAAGGDPGRAATNAQATAAYGQSTKLANSIRMLDPGAQRTMWNNMGGDEQTQLRSVGYMGPPAQARGGGGGFFHSLVRDVGGAITGASKAIGTAVTTGLEDMGMPLRAVQHGIRTGIYAATDVSADPRGGALSPSAQNFRPGTGWGTFFSPHEWATAWRATNNGEAAFNPGVLRQLAHTTDPTTLNLAQRVAAATSENFGANTPDPKAIAAITKGMDPTTAQQAVDQINNDKAFKDLVNQLVASKLNFGNFLLGERAMAQHGEVAKALSGTANAIVDWFGDPLIVGGKLSKAVKAARYTVATPEDVQRLYQTRPTVQRNFQLIADHLQPGADGKPDVAGLIRAQPKLAPAAEEMSRAGITSADDVANWFAGKAGFHALMQGRAGGLDAEGARIIPNLSRAQLAGIQAKGAMSRVIDWAASPAQIADHLGVPTQDTPLLRRAVAFPGRAAQSLTRLVPEGDSFNPDSPHAITVVQRLSQLFLPRQAADNVVNAWSAADTLGAKRQIYKGLVDNVFKAARLNDEPVTNAWRDRFLTNLDGNLGHEMYSTVEDGGGRIDQLMNNGVENSAGILEDHLTNEWSVPQFSQLLQHSSSATVTRKLMSGVNSDVINKFMESAWKPLLLLRLGFPIRAGGEELFGALLRHSPLSLARSRLAMSYVGSQTKAADKILPWHPLRNITQHLGDNALRRAVQSPADLVAETFGDQTRRAFRGVQGALAGQRYVDAARSAYEGGYLENAMAEKVSATHTNGLGYLESPETTFRFAKDGSVARRAQLVPTGKFRGYAPTDDLYKQVYKKGLDEIAGSPWARTALEHLDAPREDAIRAIADKLEQTPDAARKSPRWAQDRAGNIVGQDITQRQALEDWADVIHKHVNGMVRDPTGVEIPTLRDHMLANHEAPALPAFNEMDETQFPLAVKGPEVLDQPISRYASVIQKGFDQIVGRPMNWMVRQPLWLHNFALEQDVAKTGMRALLGDSPNVDQLAADAAAESATRKTIPYIHNPQLRSQFSVATKNLMPFWFAQEQFYKRWVNNFRYAPEAFRKAQLIMMGLRHSGFVHTDDQGNDYFMYPVIGQAATEAISKGVEMVTGQKISLPIPVGFTGDVRYVTPGLERLGLPSFGPLVSVPMKALTQRFPELNPAESALLGRGATSSYWEQIVPTDISRLVNTFTAQPDTSPQYASAMMQAIQYLDANGYGVPRDAPASIQQQYIDRVKNWTRILFAVRTVLGFAAPASPTINLDPKQMNQRLRNLMNELPANEALSQFVKENPDATAYTVFQSESPGKASIPATQGALDFMDKNKEFLSAYPQAGAWFVPQDTGVFDQSAYNEQLALGLRQRRTPEQFLNQILYASAATDYFDTDRAFKDAIGKAKGNSSLKTQLTAQWDTFKTGYLQANPVFAQMLQAGQSRLDRQQTLTELSQAVHDPRAPKSPQITHLTDLVDTYQAFQRYDAQLAGRRDAVATGERKAANQQLIDWVDQYVKDNPDVQPVFQRLILPDLTPADQTAAQNAGVGA